MKTSIDYNQPLKRMKQNAQSKGHTLYSCESVGKGHPDKIADQCSDAVVDAFLSKDSMARVAVECAVKDSEVMLFGEVNSHALEVYGQLPKIIRTVISSNIGYNRDGLGLNGETCSISIRIGQQANEIEVGTKNAETVGESAQGAGDQGMMIGFACNETKQLMPLPHMYAHSMVKGLNHLMDTDPSYGLRPDNKAMVTVEYDTQGKPYRVACIVVAQQHDPNVTKLEIESVVKKVAKEIDSEQLIDSETLFIVNGTGSFVLGGPHADAGLTGRKVIVDTYGSYAKHGGGAFSGKDPSKVDRSAAYMARYLAKQIVGNGYADRAEVQLSYCIGIAEPVSVYVNTFGTAKEGTSDLELTQKILEKFDLSPYGIIKFLKLKETAYQPTATYGHFGWDEYPWEMVLPF